MVDAPSFEDTRIALRVDLGEHVPHFEPYLKRDDQVRRVVAQNPSPPPIDRPELEASGVVKMVAKAISPTDRYPGAAQSLKRWGGPGGPPHAPHAQKSFRPPRVGLSANVGKP